MFFFGRILNPAQEVLRPWILEIFVFAILNGEAI